MDAFHPHEERIKYNCFYCRYCSKSELAVSLGRYLLHEVVDVYPEIISLIIEAKNGPGGINRRQSTFEVLLQILDTSISTSKESGLPDWALVQRIVGRTKPACLNILPELVGFVVSCSGGKNGKFLRELVDIWKTVG